MKADTAQTMWHTAIDGVQQPPMTAEQLHREIAAGRVTADTLVWRPGLDAWKRASDTELASFLLPPPLPTEQPATPEPQIQPSAPTTGAAAVDLPGYTDPRGLANFVCALLVAGLLLAIVSTWSSNVQLDLMHDARAGNFSSPAAFAAAAETSDARQASIGMFELGLLLFTAVVFLMWVHRIQKNVRAFGAQDLRITPGWAVGYFFVPIVNLWKPYQAMADAWRASIRPRSWGDVPTGWQVQLWWFLWIVSNFIGTMVFRRSMETSGEDVSLDALTSLTHVMIADSTIHAVLCLAAMAVVLGLSARQASTASELRTTGGIA